VRDARFRMMSDCSSDICTAAALTIPSALSMIVSLFPDPQEQSRGLGAFGACGALGNSTSDLRHQMTTLLAADRLLQLVAFSLEVFSWSTQAGAGYFGSLPV
jgi:hypothetical protein